MTISLRRMRCCLVGGLLAACLAANANAGDLRITLPKRSRLTPVQRLNRDGVEAIKKHRFDKAKAAFYEAYLYDPGDPFTLNNLGYVAELEGDAVRAQAFYTLATAQATDALIDRASSSRLEGESLQGVISAVHDTPMQINRANVRAVRLFSEGRVREADELLQRTLALDPKNAFTLNNMGVAKEAQGDYAQALEYYKAAAATHVEDPVIITMSVTSRGKPLNEVARESEARLSSRMRTLDSTDAKAALLNLRGVAALNRNDRSQAWQFFSEAYKLAPESAFSLNNQGYMAEINGDLESAQEFYREARNRNGSVFRVGLATRPEAEGMRLFSVAEESENQAGNAIDVASENRRRNPGPIQLKRRDGTLVDQPTAPTQTPPQQ